MLFDLIVYWIRKALMPKAFSRSFLLLNHSIFLETDDYLLSMSFSICWKHKQVKEILRRIPEETRKKLAAKGHVPQEGYILEYLPVPPNCLSVPEVSDGSSSMAVVKAVETKTLSLVH